MSGLGLALAVAGAPTLAENRAGQAPTAEAVTRLETMKKAADELDEGADPAAYRKAWDEVLRYAETLYPKGHPELAVAESELVTADYLQGDVQGALARTDRLIAVLEGAGPAYTERVTDLMNGRMVMLMALTRHGEARTLGAEILKRRRAQYAGKPHTQVAAALSNYANAEFEFGNYDAAIDLVREAIREAERLTPVPPNAAIWYSNLPVYLRASGQLEDAETAAQATSARLDTLLPPGHPFAAQNLNTLAQVQLQLGRAADAETTARHAVEIAEAKLGRKPQTAVYMNSLAQALNAQGKADEAKAIAEGALGVLEKDLGPEAERTLIAREALASALARTGERDRAIAIQKEIAAIRSRTLPPHHRDRIGGADRLAILALEAGALAEAETRQAEAQALRKATLPPDDLGALAGEARLGAIQVFAGRKVEGLARATAAAAGMEARLRQMAAAGTQRTRHAPEVKEVYLWALDAAEAAGDADAAFRFAQRYMMTSADRAVMEAAARTAASDPDTARLLRERQDAALEVDRQMDRHLRAAARGAGAEELAGLTQSRQALAARLDNLTETLRTRAPDLVAEELPDPIGLDAAQRTLRPDEALLAVATGHRGGTIFALTREGARMLKLGAEGPKVANLVDRVRTGLETGAGETVPFDFAASGALHKLLLPEAVRSALSGKKTLLVSVHGALASLPLAVLAPEAPRANFRTAKWLIRDHAIVTLPSIAALAASHDDRESAAASRFVAIGAPVLGSLAPDARPAFRSAANARKIADLPPLPATGKELAQIAAALQAKETVILTGDAATEAAIRETDFKGTRLLAFATHGMLAGELDGLEEPALVVTPAGADDGLLTASEIARLRIDADWIVLSACNTAGGDNADGGGLTGLARAFLHAGGRNLLASHWPVRDDAAAWLTTQTARRYGRGAAPADALREAMLAMIAGKGIKDSTHPANWAPFVLVGR
jgi:CHAT domain-containing protein